MKGLPIHPSSNRLFVKEGSGGLESIPANFGRDVHGKCTMHNLVLFHLFEWFLIVFNFQVQGFSLTSLRFHFAYLLILEPIFLHIQAGTL